ncbi:MAG: helix-turn-helix domain-containing protein [Phormidesmis sp.]
MDSLSITKLRALMQAANISSYRDLAEQAGVSRWQVQQLRSGNIEKMRVMPLRQIAQALDVDLPTLWQTFSGGDSQTARANSEDSDPSEVATAITSTAITSTSIKSDALQTLETWLIQWPTIAKRAQEKGDALSAAKILPFVRPVEQLMREWGVEPIAAVDEQVPYNPQYQQLTEGAAAPGDLVRVTHTGSRCEGKLLHRAKVKPING